jgi:hypothetical protein
LARCEDVKRELEQDESQHGEDGKRDHRLYQNKAAAE